MKLGWCVLLAVVACGGKKDPATQGGSGTAGSGSAVAVVGDAAATADAAPAADPAKLITPTALGPLTTATKVDLAALKQLVPGLHWSENETESGGEAQQVFEGRTSPDETGPIVMQVVAADGSKLGEVHVFAAGYTTALGVGVGHTGEALAKAYPDLACTFESGELDELSCTSPSLATVSFTLELPSGVEPGDVPAARVAAQKIEAIHWRPEVP